MKCNLIGFEMELNIKADIMSLQKNLLFIIKTHFSFQGEKFVSKAHCQLLVFWTLPKPAFYISLMKEQSHFITAGTLSGKKNISDYCIHQHSWAVPTWERGMEEWQWGQRKAVTE